MTNAPCLQHPRGSGGGDGDGGIKALPLVPLESALGGCGRACHELLVVGKRQDAEEGRLGACAYCTPPGGLSFTSERGLYRQKGVL